MKYPVYEISCLWNILFMKYPVYEMLFMKCYLWNVIYEMLFMKCPFYEMLFMKCPIIYYGMSQHLKYSSKNPHYFNKTMCSAK